MLQTVEFKLLPALAADPVEIHRAAAARCDWAEASCVSVVRKKSIDARTLQPLVLLLVDVYKDETPPEIPIYTPTIQKISQNARPVLIVGAGPAGYFAALELLGLGLKPIIFERGKDVQARRRDLRAIQQAGEVNPHSNYCFGEGGAGTYSDGKLYTRSVKRGDWRKVLYQLVEHGANPDILADAHPHIGSNKLPLIVAAIRQTILNLGGEIHFDSFVTDFIFDKKTRLQTPQHTQKIIGLVVNQQTEYFGEAVILATGHSARDIYNLCQKRNVLLEAKPFALGVRIEHPQPLIDEIQYRQRVREEHLPASSYKLVCQVQARGVFSFCMCPGGLVVPAATAPGEIVVNGMSMSRRDSPFANSGTVTSVELEDLVPYQSHGVFAGLAFQRDVEQTLFQAGDGSQCAPAQRLTDFVKGRTSETLNKTSYIPGLWSAPLHGLLPFSISDRLRQAVKQFGKQMHGYYTEEANVIGTESRTSSPVKIPRDSLSFMHPTTSHLFPCGEGAGFAGGILSAAMDGQNVANAIAAYLNQATVGWKRIFISNIRY